MDESCYAFRNSEREIFMAIHFNDPIEQDIWATDHAMNDAWTRGNPDDLAQFFHRKLL